MRQSALLLVSLAFLEAGLAFDASAAEPALCESTPNAQAAGAESGSAAAENARGNQLSHAGDPRAALAAHEAAERLARAG